MANIKAGQIVEVRKEYDWLTTDYKELVDLGVDYLYKGFQALNGTDGIVGLRFVSDPDVISDITIDSMESFSLDNILHYKKIYAKYTQIPSAGYFKVRSW